MELTGKVVVVTGASMGIGEAIAKVFAEQGAGVVLLSRDTARAEAARERVGFPERTVALSCDVRQSLPCKERLRLQDLQRESVFLL